MSNLTKLEEVALAIVSAQHYKATEIDVYNCFHVANDFLKTSKEDFKDSEFNKPDINGIEVVGNVEVKNYDLNSHILSAADIANCLGDCEKELNEKQILNPVDAIKIVSTNLANMASKKLKEANNNQFNG